MIAPLSGGQNVPTALSRWQMIFGNHHWNGGLRRQPYHREIRSILKQPVQPSIDVVIIDEDQHCATTDYENEYCWFVSSEMLWDSLSEVPRSNAYTDRF